MAASDFEGFEAGDDAVIWRYMSISRLQSLLTEGLYFAAAHQFEDAFEGAVTEGEVAWRRDWAQGVFPEDPLSQQGHLDRISRAFADLRRMMKISCWHAAEIENIGMWERYLPARAEGVAIRSTVASLKAALRPFRLQPGFGEEPIVVGAVRYIDYVSDEMVDRAERAIFLHKRAEYQDEREVRAILSLRMASEFNVPIPMDGAFVSVDGSALIHDMRVRSNCTDSLEAVRGFAASAGVRCPIEPSSLSRPPTY